MDSEHCEAPHLCFNRTFAGSGHCGAPRLRSSPILPRTSLLCCRRRKAAIAVRPCPLHSVPLPPPGLFLTGKRPLRCAPVSVGLPLLRSSTHTGKRPLRCALSRFPTSLPQPHLSECRIAAIAVRPCLPSPRPHYGSL